MYCAGDKKKSIILAFKKLIIQLSKPLSLESDFKVWCF